MNDFFKQICLDVKNDYNKSEGKSESPLYWNELDEEEQWQLIKIKLLREVELLSEETGE